MLSNLEICKSGDDQINECTDSYAQNELLWEMRFNYQKYCKLMKSIRTILHWILLIITLFVITIYTTHIHFIKNFPHLVNKTWFSLVCSIDDERLKKFILLDIKSNYNHFFYSFFGKGPFTREYFIKCDFIAYELWSYPAISLKMKDNINYLNFLL